MPEEPAPTRTVSIGAGQALLMNNPTEGKLDVYMDLEGSEEFPIIIGLGDKALAMNLAMTREIAMTLLTSAAKAEAILELLGMPVETDDEEEADDAL